MTRNKACDEHFKENNSPKSKTTRTVDPTLMTVASHEIKKPAPLKLLISTPAKYFRLGSNMFRIHDILHSINFFGH